MATADDDTPRSAPDARVPPGTGSLDETARAEPGDLSATALGVTDPPGRDRPVPAAIGRYQVNATLGEGGMGLVLLATDPLLGRRVAIKVLRGHDGATDQAARQRLLREAQGMAQLSHDNVIVVHEVGVHGDRVYLAMEYVAGGTLTRWQAGRDWREILDAYVRAGRGLQAAHDAGLVHRDFKPDNVLVGDDGRVRVTDFGLVATPDAPAEVPSTSAIADRGGAPLVAKLTATGAIMGTPRYMAPEQHLGQPVDARADQFAFCVALYEALYHAPPFAGRDYAALASNVVAGEVGPVPADSPVPIHVRDAVLRGLRRARTDRHASMRELLALISIGDPSAAGRRRWPLAIGAGGGVIVVALALAVAMRDPRAKLAPAAPPAAPAPAQAVGRSVVDAATSALDIVNLGQALAAFDAATLDFTHGRYDAAARGFERAHAALPVPQLLYDVGASLYLQGKRAGDARAYAGAVDAYARYLASDPMAPGLADAIEVIKREIERLDRGHPGTAAATPVEPSAEIQQLADPALRGFLVLISKPAGATIYVDDERNGPFGVTPWSGTLTGAHTILISKRGYGLVTKAIVADPARALVLQAVLEPPPAR